MDRGWRAHLAAGVVLLVTAAGGLAAASERVEYVIHISVDGLRGDLLRDLIATDTTGDYEGFQRLTSEGAGTFNGRSDFTNTRTLPNHITMITGRPVSRPNGAAETLHHGYTTNLDPPSTDVLHNSGNPAVAYFASVFDVVHDHGLSTALYVSKSKFVLFNRAYDGTNGAPDVTGDDDGADKIDVYVQRSEGVPATAAPMHSAFLAAMTTERFNYVFLHYLDLDEAAHEAGWESAAYNTAVANVSGYVLEVLELVETDPHLAGRTIVILTSDHGGTGTDHSNSFDWRNYTIPFFVWGPDVPAGVDLYELSGATRLDPGDGRPSYNAAVQPIRNGDSGNLALDLLGLPPIPGSMINVAQDLVVQQCPCERTGDVPAAVDVLDLLAYLDAWFSADASAEMTGDSELDVIDVFDLLVYLDCWFPASSGAACP